MKKLIKEYINNYSDIIEEAKKIKEKYNNNNIRIDVSGSNNQSYNSQECYYYDPMNDEIYEGEFFVSGNSFTYYYQNIGNIEIIITRNPGYEDYDYIEIKRIIRPEDENMSYANEFEEEKYKEVEKNDIYLSRHDKYMETGKKINECIKCKHQYIVNQSDFEKGKYAILNEEDKIICSKCTPQQTIEKFLNTIQNEEKREEYKFFLIDYSGAELDWDLFV